MQTPGSGNPIPHLWFIITEANSETSQCAIVSLTTLRGDKDQTVVLGRSDHSFISHPSVVHYTGARIVDMRLLVSLVAAKTIQQHRSCSPGILKLIQQGVSGSPFTPRKVVDFCRQAWLTGSPLK
jgi:hypothetical protein